MSVQIRHTTALNMPNVWTLMEVMSVRVTRHTQETAQCAPVRIVLMMLRLHFHLCDRQMLGNSKTSSSSNLPPLSCDKIITFYCQKCAIAITFVLKEYKMYDKKATASVITSSLWSCQPFVHYARCRTPSSAFSNGITSDLAGLFFTMTHRYVKQGNCEYQFSSHCFDPTRNRNSNLPLQLQTALSIWPCDQS